MRSVVECAGVLFEVTYVRDSRNVITYKHASVLDANYHPVGPNLAEFLHEALFLTGNPRNEAETALSVITGELNEHADQFGRPR